MKRILITLFILLFSMCFLFSCKKNVDENNKTTEKPQEIYTIPLGDYQDSQSQRATLKVSFVNKVYCFEINWASSAWENTKWVFSGAYNINAGGIIYNNAICYAETYDDEGNCKSAEVYHDGNGSMIYNKGKLYWTDMQEERREDEEYNGIFERLEYEDKDIN